MYPDLQLRFEPDTIEKQELTNDLGELLANFSASRLQNSYDVLLCHKCLSYDCMMHAATTADGYNGATQSNVSFKRMRSVSKENETISPCTNQCYLNKSTEMVRELRQRTSTGSIMETSPNKNMNKLRIDVGSNNRSSTRKVKNTWTPHDESIFNFLRVTGENHYCRITWMLNVCTRNKKTCREVYEYACRKAPISPRLELQESPSRNKCRKGKDTHRTFRAMKWANTNGRVENTGMFKPCKHEGPCREGENCYCVSANNLCTKYCGCSDECENRFPGCRCATGNCRTKQCQCYYASWECDPDICKSCNCDKFDITGEPICKNVSIQRGLQKRLIVAPSQVAGWGCYANEDIEKNDFISEYCGEVISQEESERRGKIYDKIKCSYLFGLNDEQVVDATKIGNVIRFANHSKNPNCRARVIVVNGDHKIGIFAHRPIKAGEELFFDYAYNKNQQVQFVPKELSQVQRVRNKLPPEHEQ